LRPREKTSSSFKNAASRRLKNQHLKKYLVTDFLGGDVGQYDRGLILGASGDFLIFNFGARYI